MKRKKELKEQELKYQVYQEEDRWFGFRICPRCFNKIKQTSLERGILLRNIRNADRKSIICLSCSKSGEKNPFFGKNHSEKSNIQISQNRRGKACGENNAMANPIYRTSVSIALKEKYDNGELDYLKEIQRKTIIKTNKSGKLNSPLISKGESELKLLLEKMSYKTKSQYRVENLRYDIFLIDYNTLIEYNGNYWHCNPELYTSDYFNKKKNMFAWQIWEQDKLKKELAEKNGYKLFIIWERDFMFNKEIEINKIINNL